MAFEQKSIQISTASFATPYSDEDCVGGLFTVGPSPNPGMAFKFQANCLVDESNVGPALVIIWFKSRPSGTFTDNSPVSFSAADKKLIIGQWSVLAIDYISTSSTMITDFSGYQKPLGRGAADPADYNIYGTVVVKQAWTATAADNLDLTLGIEDDGV